MTLGPGTCRDCREFETDPDALEAALRGLPALGSAFAANRRGDGLCRRHDRHCSGDASCAAFRVAARLVA